MVPRTLPAKLILGGSGRLNGFGNGLPFCTANHPFHRAPRRLWGRLVTCGGLLIRPRASRAMPRKRRHCLRLAAMQIVNLRRGPEGAPNPIAGLDTPLRVRQPRALPHERASYRVSRIRLSTRWFMSRVGRALKRSRASCAPVRTVLNGGHSSWRSPSGGYRGPEQRSVLKDRV
jgi:hypothetical protein